MSEEEKTNKEEKKEPEVKGIIKHIHELGKGFIKESEPATDTKGNKGKKKDKDNPTDDPKNTPKDDTPKDDKKEEKKEPTTPKEGEKKEPLKKIYTPEEIEGILKEKRALEDIIEVETVKAFKEEKETLLKEFPEDERKGIEEMIGDDPETLEEIRRQLQIRKALTPPKPPEKKEGEGTDEGGTDEGEGGKPKTAEEIFKEEKQALLDMIDDPIKKQFIDEKIGDDPKELDNIRLWSNILTRAIESGGGTVTGRAPAGKATKPPETPEGAGYKKVIDDIYSELNDPNIKPERKMALESMKTELWGAVFAGLKQAGRLPNWQMQKCPRCGTMILAPRGTTGKLSRAIMECPNCGWKPTKYVDPREQRG